MAAVSKNHRIYRRSSFIVVATTANQVVLSVDLSAYGGGATTEAAVHLILTSAVVQGTPASGIYEIVDFYASRFNSGAGGNWANLSTRSVKPTPSGFIDLVFSGNTLQVRVDGQANQMAMIFELEGLVSEYDSAA
jgi:hypothetical protein